MLKVLYFFPDTNVFIQCRPLDQVDWSAWKEFDEVHLVVSRPVQSEIDNQKNKGFDRLRNRARSTSSFFREIILSDSREKVIREASPGVKIIIRQDLRPSPDLGARLNYAERDDQLVGIVHAFIQQNPGAEALLLTGDTGPMASAQMVGVPFVATPDDWLLPPESNETDKKIGALQAEVARLRKAEPEFKIAFVNRECNPLSALHIEATRSIPLADNQISELMDRLKLRFPMATDFGGREPMERPATGVANRFLNVKEIFTPATEEEIDSYRQIAYPKWIEDCERTLHELHTIAQSQEDIPLFCFAVTNEGTRPAKDALITFEAKGDFTIMPSDDEGGKKPNRKPLALFAPPEPPRGIWRVKPLMGAFDSISAMQRAMGYARPLPADIFRSLPSLGDLNPRRDPNAFYWKPRKSETPVTTLSLECEQWRHGVQPELFAGEIHFDKKKDAIAGALECWIHAENLTDPVLMRVPVRIEVRDMELYETAEALVRRLVEGGPSRRLFGR